MEEVRKCSIWVLRGSSGVQCLLESTYSAQMVPHTLFTIVLDFSQPWKLKQCLQAALQQVESIITKLQVPQDVVGSLKNKLQTRVQTYCDNETESKQKKTTSADDLLPLSEGVLSESLGVPIMVLCTKLDSMVDLEKTHKYNDEHFDYIQQWLRTECMKIGASLVYTSSRDSRYLPVLYKLILNSLFEVLPKTGSLASVVQKDSICVPIGWDNALKIKTVQDNLIGEIKVDDSFEEVCKQPAQNAQKRNLSQEVSGTPLMADEEQIFLNRSQTALQKPVQSGSSISSPLARPGMATPGGTKTPLNASNGGEANLQQFFNSLLNSKTRGTPSGTASGLSSPMKNSSAAATKPIIPQTAATVAPPAATANGTTEA